MLAGATGDALLGAADQRDQDEAQLVVPGGATAQPVRSAVARLAEGLPR